MDADPEGSGSPAARQPSRTRSLRLGRTLDEVCRGLDMHGPLLARVFVPVPIGHHFCSFLQLRSAGSSPPLILMHVPTSIP